MKIMIFDASEKWSGGANSIFLFSKELRKRGHQVMVCCRFDSDLSARLRKENIPVFILDPRSDVNISVIPKIITLLKENNIDIIDIHSPKYYWLASIAGRFMQIPVILTRNVPFRKTGIKRLLNKILYKNIVHTIIAISEKIGRELKEDYDINDKILNIIHDGIEIEKFSLPKDKKSFNIQKDSFTIGILSRLDRGKGLEYAIDAIPSIIKNIPSISFIIAGKGSIEQELKDKVKQLKLESNVTFIGFTEDIYTFFNNIDISLMPSPEEGMPMSALESMASGVPVVVTKGSGFIDIITNMHNGVIVETHSSTAIAEGVLQLLQADYRRIGKNARVVIEQQFALQHVVTQYESLVASLINK